MYGARRSGMKRETFGYVEGGYASILERFDEHLARLGVGTIYGARVAEVRAREDRVQVSLPNGAREFDDVILTIPCSRAADLCPQLTEVERARLRGVRYQGIVCAAVLLEAPLADYYITNITDPRVPFTAVIEMTALVDRSRFGGHALVYLPKYLTQQDPFWARTDAQVEDEFLGALERMYPRFRRRQVKSFQVSRVREMLAVTTLEYSARLLPPSATSLDRVFIVNSSQIANGTLNVNEALGLADRKIEELLPRLHKRSMTAPAAAGAA
jgi:protoporphyrinogen oxidase